MIGIILIRAKFTNDTNCFVREVGRGRDLLERSLEIADVLRGVDDGDKKPVWVCTYFGRRIAKVYLVVSSNFCQLSSRRRRFIPGRSCESRQQCI